MTVTIERPAKTEPTAATPVDAPRVVGGRTRDDVFSLVGSASGALALVWLVFNMILGWSGLLGFTIVWFVAFVVIYAAVTSWTNPMTAVVDRLAAAVVTGGAVVVGLALAST